MVWRGLAVEVLKTTKVTEMHLKICKSYIFDTVREVETRACTIYDESVLLYSNLFYIFSSLYEVVKHNR